MRIILAILLLGNLGLCKSQIANTAGTETQKINNDDTFMSDKTFDTNNGIVYFSFDNGTTWENKSKGLPDDISLTDIAVSDEWLGVSTKQNGIFLFDFKTNSWKKVATNPKATKNIDALYFHKKKIFAGTQNGGIFVSGNEGKTWTSNNDKLGNLTIRKFAVIGNKLFVCTDGGLYSLNEQENKWVLEFGEKTLQVNGITEFNGEIYIGANRGVFKVLKHQKEWKHVLSDRSLHNISSDDKTVYALVYNELFASIDNGNTWQSDQKGMPYGKYTFQIVHKDKTVLAGQWDGIYRKESISNWVQTNKGLPYNFAVTEMKIFKDKIIIASSSGWAKKQSVP